MTVGIADKSLGVSVWPREPVCIKARAFPVISKETNICTYPLHSIGHHKYVS